MKKNKFLNWAGYILILVIILGACKSQTENKNSPQEIPPLAVRTVLIGEKIFSEKIKSSGMLSSKSEIKLAFKTGGMIKKSYVNEGQQVRAGQLLAELDLSEIEAGVNQARIAQQKAKRDFERAEALFKDEAITRTMLNDAKSGLDVAEETLKAAEFNRKLSKIHAPVSGRILMKLAEQGELIGPFMPMFILGDGSQAYVVKVGLTDRNIVKVNMGDHAEVTLDAFSNEIFTGKVTQIAQMINPNTGTYEIEVQINPKGKRLLSGFVAQISIRTGQSAPKLVVPIEALVNAHGRDADVYVLSGETAQKKHIKIGQIFETFVEVLEGLNENEEVITQGSGFVSDGQKVRISKS